MQMAASTGRRSLKRVMSATSSSGSSRLVAARSRRKAMFWGDRSSPDIA